jgi:hypothetical protein
MKPVTAATIPVRSGHVTVSTKRRTHPIMVGLQAADTSITATTATIRLQSRLHYRDVIPSPEAGIVASMSAGYSPG